jgi:hypothetical protein
MWTLKEHAKGQSKWDNARQAKSLLESLNGMVPGLLQLQVGIDFSRTESSADLVLFSEFEDRTALEEYLRHPEHQKVAVFIGEIRTERLVVDYEF